MKRRPKVIRFLYLSLGTISLIIGIIGIPLPIIPTVPFFLLTSYLYARGSERFHVWFINSKVYKRYVSGLAEHRTMSVTGELTLLLLVSLMLFSVTLSFPDSLAISIILPSLDIIKWTYFVFRIKTVSRTELMFLRESINKEEEEA